MSDIVTLHETNAGHLFIIQDGAQLAYDVTEAAEPEGFEFDAAALLDGDTDDWTVPTLPAEEIAGTPMVAEYDGTTGEVRVLADRVGGTSAGRAARVHWPPALQRVARHGTGRRLTQTIAPCLPRPHVTLYPY